MKLLDEDGRVLISPSRLNTWLTCPLKWKAMYVDEVSLQPTASMIFGTGIHRALEMFHRARWMQSPISTEALQLTFQEVVVAEYARTGLAVADQDEFTRQSTGLLGLYVERYGTDTVSAAEQSLTAPMVDTETGEDLEATLVGVIDLITSEGAVDIKTTARTSNLFDLTLQHSLQLDAYRWLLKNSGVDIKSVEVRLLVRRKTPVIESFRLPVKPTFESFLRTCRRYVAFVRNQEATTPRPNMFCGESCPAYSLCRVYHGLEVAA